MLLLSSLIEHIRCHLPGVDLDTELQNPDLNGSALELLALLPDPRKRRGIRHPLHLLLSLAAAAQIANHNTYTQMNEYAVHLWETHPHWGKKFLHGPPSADTFERIFAILDAGFFDLAQTQWVTRKLSSETPPHDAEESFHQQPDFRVFSVDGKESRSAKHGAGTRSHNLAAADHATGVVIAQVAVGEKSNEIPYLKNLLEGIDEASPRFLPGAVITIDALCRYRPKMRCTPNVRPRA